MTTTRLKRRGAVATYVLLGLLTLLVGAGAMWSYKGDAEVVIAGGSYGFGDHARRVGIREKWARLHPGLCGIPRAKDQGSCDHRDPRDLRSDKWEPTVADRLAKEGYVAILPDLLSSKYGITPADPDSGRKLVGQLEPERVTTDLNAVYAYVNGLPAVSKDLVGTIGFCWGGGQSFRYATNNPKLRAVVVAYGPAPDTADLKRIKAPVLGIYGENDERINGNLPEVTAAMQSAGKTFTSEVYPGTGHGFLKPGRQGSDGPQVEKAWTRILEFYRARLGSAE